MVYTNSIATIKWWDTYIKRLRYCSSAQFDEHKNKFVRGWSPCSELMLGTKHSTLQTLKIDISYHPFVKDDIFEFNVNLPPRVTLIGIVAQYCEHHNMSYISQ